MKNLDISITKIEQNEENQLIRDLKRQIAELEEKVSELDIRNKRLVRKCEKNQESYLQKTTDTIDFKGQDQTLKKKLRLYEAKFKKLDSEVKNKWNNAQVYLMILLGVIISFTSRPHIAKC